MKESINLFKKLYGNKKANIVVCLPYSGTLIEHNQKIKKCNSCKGKVLINRHNPKKLISWRRKYICILCLQKMMKEGLRVPEELKNIVNNTLR